MVEMLFQHEDHGILRLVAQHHQKLPAYECELINILQLYYSVPRNLKTAKNICCFPVCVRHWQPYVWGRVFTVPTNNYNLKFLLDQRLSTVPQHTLVSKLFGYDLTVEYRPGKLNGAMNALSCHEEDVAAVLAFSAPIFAPFDRLRAEVQDDPEVAAVHAQLEGAPSKWAGPSPMTLCCSGAKYSFRRHLRSGQSSCPTPTAAMKASRSRDSLAGIHLQSAGAGPQVRSLLFCLPMEQI
jgi:hypothetical protein